MDHFYPRSPCGERLGTLRTVKVRKTFLSTLSLRRATKIRLVTPDISSISIHALLAESDLNAQQRHLPKHPHFYPRSPCGERLVFAGILPHDRRNFYPRSPCGERQSSIEEVSKYVVISIHALLAESDICVL